MVLILNLKTLTLKPLSSLTLCATTGDRLGTSFLDGARRSTELRALLLLLALLLLVAAAPFVPLPDALLALLGRAEAPPLLLP